MRIASLRHPCHRADAETLANNADYSGENSCNWRLITHAKGMRYECRSFSVLPCVHFLFCRTLVKVTRLSVVSAATAVYAR